MKKFFIIILSALTFTLNGVANDFTVLSSPQEIIKYSTEVVVGAKANLKSVIEDPDATEAQKTAAVEEYLKKANPKAGYAFDMSFLLQYNCVSADNKGKYTQTSLAEYWKCDIPGITFGSNSVFINFTNDNNGGTYMRLASNILSDAASYNKFAIYQNVDLEAGCYYLSTDAFVVGLANSATLSAGDYADSKTITGAPLKSYDVHFSVDKQATVKLGLKRNSTTGKLTQIAFNSMNLYKLSGITVIAPDATRALDAANNINVQLNRNFNQDTYTPICLPFVIENWREIFDDVIIWNNYANGQFEFSTLKGANTQARKPYLVKTKENIDADNFLMFNNVTVQAGNSGSWVKSVTEGEEPFPVTMVGNWATGKVPAGCYYLDDNIWKLSDGTISIPAFSAYMNATDLATHPSTVDFVVNNVNAGIDDVTINRDTPVNVYSLQGIMIRRNVPKGNALNELPAGIYIINGKKIVKQ